MHPTRRIKMLELMLKDPRKFIIATHSTEFTPVFEKNCVIYKMYSYFQDGFERPKCKFKNAKTLLDAFDIAYSLGYEPSKLLFTSNCIIWIEGPSDLIYLRFWINRYLKQMSVDDPSYNLLEGFDYTFMFSSGALLARFNLEQDFTDKLEQDMINILHITPCSIFIVDTDVDEERSDDFKKALENFDINDNEIFSFLKKRVQNIKKASDKANNEGYKSCVKLTFGREIENFIPNNCFHDVLINMFKLKENEDKNDIEIIKKIEVNRWESFEKVINESILNSESPSDKILNKDKMKYFNKLRDKAPFATEYINFYNNNGEIFEIDKNLNDNGKLITDIVNVIKIIKESYHQ
jgi:hypothetical protein